MNDLTIGQKAPDFWLPTDEETQVTPSDLKGKAIVLYFYPKDDTSGCTAQAVGFSNLLDQFEAANAVVIGVSKDSLKSHQKFRQKYDLKIKLASDSDTQVAEQFGVWVQKSMYGRTYMGLERSTFLIDRDGKIAQIWRKVKVPGHAEQVLGFVQKLV
jgi:thioredoxin-dependent peroxiredoxin